MGTKEMQSCIVLSGQTHQSFVLYTLVEDIIHVHVHVIVWCHKRNYTTSNGYIAKVQDNNNYTSTLTSSCISGGRAARTSGLISSVDWGVGVA